MQEFDAWVKRARARWGDDLDLSYLPDKWRPYLNGPRIEVALDGEDVTRGRVGITTGWRPVFLLVRRRSDRGSSIILVESDELLRVVSK